MYLIPRSKGQEFKYAKKGKEGKAKEWRWDGDWSGCHSRRVGMVLNSNK